MKQEFLNFLNALMDASPDLTNSLMTDTLKSYIEALSSTSTEKPEITDNGKQILKYLLMYKEKRVEKLFFFNIIS